MADEFTTPQYSPSYQTPPPAYRPPAPPTKFFKGFSCGCLVSVLFIFLFFGLVLGSLVLMSRSSSSDNANPFANGPARPRLIPYRNGQGDRMLAIISIRGVIGAYPESDLFGEETGASSRRICAAIRAAAENPDIAGILLDMDTPGGEVVASAEIRNAVDEYRSATKNPVVTCIHSLGASGGYYVASGTDWIVANRNCITGSVGVIMQSMQLHGLMDKIGVKPVTYRSGKYKDILNPMRESTPEEAAYIQHLIDQNYTEFCRVIAEGRSKHFKDADAVKKAEFADGRPVSGEDAFAQNLVDQLGSLNDAIAKLEELTRLSNAPIVRIGVTGSFMDRLFGAFSPAPRRVRIEGMPGTMRAADLPPGVFFYLLPESLR